MADSERTLTWHIEEANAKKIAYHIFNGIKVARNQGVERYENLLDKYKVRILNSKTVEAEWLNKTIQQAPLVFNDISDSLSALSIIIQQQDTCKSFFFKSQFMDDDIEDIRSWAADNQYNVHIQPDGIKVEKI